MMFIRFAGNTQTEPASYREITAMSRRGKIIQKEPTQQD